MGFNVYEDLGIIRRSRPTEELAPAPPSGAAADAPDFTRGAGLAFSEVAPIARGAIGAVGAAAEKVVGEGGLATGLKNWGLKGFEEGMKRLEPKRKESDELTTAWEKAKEGDVGALIDWAQYGLGYGLGQVAQAGVTSVAGGLIGGAVAGPAGVVPGAVAGAAEGAATRAAAKTLIEKLVEREARSIATANGFEQAASAAARSQIAKAAMASAPKSLGSRLGSNSALALFGVGQSLGSIYPTAEAEALKEGRELDGADMARIFGSAIAAGGIEAWADRFGLDILTGKKGVDVGGAVSRGLTGAARGAGAEGATEAAQTAVERFGAGQAVFSDEGQKDIINSAALGALTGGAVGGARGVISRPEQNLQVVDPLAGRTASVEPVAPVPPAPPIAPVITPDIAAAPQTVTPTPAETTAAIASTTSVRDAIVAAQTIAEQSSAKLREVTGAAPIAPAQMAPPDPGVLAATANAQREIAAQRPAWASPEEVSAHLSEQRRAGARMRPTKVVQTEQGYSFVIKGEPGYAKAVAVDAKPLDAAVPTPVTTTDAATIASPEPVPTADTVAVAEPGRAPAETAPAVPAVPQEQQQASVQPVTVRKANGEPFATRRAAEYVKARQPNRDEWDLVELGPKQFELRRKEAVEPTPPVAPVATQNSKVETPVDQAAQAAATSPTNDLPQPTDGQKKAGNFPKGHAKVSGFDLSIENPMGSKRTGVDPNGKAWSNTMRAHYGSLKGTTGRDKDQVDVFVKQGTPDDYDGPVFVIDQKKPGNGHFDEHKVILGAETQALAERLYKGSYSKDWDGIRAITETTVAELKQFLADAKALPDRTKIPEFAKWRADRNANPAATKPEPKDPGFDSGNADAVRAEPTATPQEPKPEPEFGEGYSRLEGVTIEQSVPVEGDEKPATLRKDAAKAMRSLDRREKALRRLLECVSK